MNLRSFFRRGVVILFLLELISSIGFGSVLMSRALMAANHTLGFEQVAEKALPAAVSIHVSGTATPRGTYGPGHGQDAYDFFSNDFWERFFSTPEGKNLPKVVSQGSGFIVSDDGYIVTNNHVVRNAAEITVVLHDGRELKGRIVGQDPNTDLAVIKVEGSDLPHLTLANSDELKVGQWVAAIGNPLGLQASMTVGVVSAKGRNNLDITNFEDFIQTDAAINRGNSGGPLINMDGEVVGVNTAIIGSRAGGYMGIGFAIPSNMAQHVMQQLIEGGNVRRGYLGVMLQNITKELADALGLESTSGALVADVLSDSPAKRAGLRRGDIILSINGKKVKGIAGVRNAVALLEPNADMRIEILRDGKPMTITTSTGSHPENIASSGAQSAKGLGIEVKQITPDTAKKLGFIGESGVVITRVVPGSLGDLVGLQPGVLIISVNQTPVNTADEFESAVNKVLAENKPILLLVKKGQFTSFVSIRVS